MAALFTIAWCMTQVVAGLMLYPVNWVCEKIGDKIKKTGWSKP